MTDRCGVDGSRRADQSYAELTCEPSAEEIERKKQESAASRQPDADARRDAWIAGSSRDAASTMGRAPACEGPTAAERAREAEVARSREKHLASMRYTAKTDMPLQPDPIGNAIPGLIAGGIVAGGSAAGAAIENVGAKVATAIAHHAVEHVAADAIEHGAVHGAHFVAGAVANSDALERAGAKAQAAPFSGSASPPDVGAGRSGSKGVSEPARDPLEGGRSEPSKERGGRDAIPYLPGKAPVRIPELASSPEASSYVVRG